MQLDNWTIGQYAPSGARLHGFFFSPLVINQIGHLLRGRPIMLITLMSELD